MMRLLNVSTNRHEAWVGSSVIPVGGHLLECLRLGPPPDLAPTLVFLHEGLGCAAMWRDFPRQLADMTGCGALVYSRAGYGGSEPVPTSSRAAVTRRIAISRSWCSSS
jgi:pimeloyl-ACP methyl ester carboxylesterase